MELLYLFIGLVLGGVAVWMVMRSKVGALLHLMEVSKQLQEEQKLQHEQYEQEQKILRQEQKEQ